MVMRSSLSGIGASLWLNAAIRNTVHTSGSGMTIRSISSIPNTATACAGSAHHNNHNHNAGMIRTLLHHHRLSSSVSTACAYHHAGQSVSSRSSSSSTSTRTIADIVCGRHTKSSVPTGTDVNEVATAAADPVEPISEVAFAPGIECGFLTDVEGNIDYFNRYVRQSRVLYFVAGTNESEVALRDGGMFVYGGDVFDKGPGDIRVSHMLVSLKRRYPSRVFLILGNRDLNKIRLSSELHESELKRPLSSFPGPYYRRDADRATPWLYICRIINDRTPGVISPSVDRPPITDEEFARENTMVNRLKWLLQDTMGSPRAFHHRRTELAHLLGRRPSQVSDEEVVESYQKSVQTGGFVQEYIKHAQIGIVIGDALFIHGGVNTRNIGYVPPMASPLSYANVRNDDMIHTNSSVQQWIGALNKWKNSEIPLWLKSPQFDERRTIRGGERLMGYANAQCMAGRGVIYTDFQKNGNPQAIPDSVVRYLNDSGIHRVIIGHQPVGNCPAVIRSSTLHVIDADTSYSAPVAGAIDQRGSTAVSEVCLTQHGTYVHGVIHDGRAIQYYLSSPASVSSSTFGELESDPYIGRHTSTGWWVKARFSDGLPKQTPPAAAASSVTSLSLPSSTPSDAPYLVSRGEGFVVHYAEHQPSSLTALKFDVPPADA